MKKDVLECLRMSKDGYGNTYRGKKRGGRSPEHEKMILRLCSEKGAVRIAFGKALNQALVYAQPEELKWWAHKHPDAFKFDEETQVLTIFEVVKTHDCDPKIYLPLWWLLDNEEWELRLEIWSHHGGCSGVYGSEEFLKMEYRQ